MVIITVLVFGFVGLAVVGVIYLLLYSVWHLLLLIFQTCKNIIVGTKNTSVKSSKGIYQYFFGVPRTRYYKHSNIIREAYREKPSGRTGLCSYFYRTGALNKKEFWKKGMRHGPCIIYYKTGEIYITALYKKNKLHGKYYVQDKAGEIIEEDTYENGVLVL